MASDFHNFFSNSLKNHANISIKLANIRDLKKLLTQLSNDFRDFQATQNIKESPKLRLLDLNELN